MRLLPGKQCVADSFSLSLRSVVAVAISSGVTSASPITFS